MPNWPCQWRENGNRVALDSGRGLEYWQSGNADVGQLITAGVEGCPRRHPSAICAGLFVLLILAVSSWGLSYKLSLYRPNTSHSARGNVAKLWSGPRKEVVAFSPSWTSRPVQWRIVLGALTIQRPPMLRSELLLHSGPQAARHVFLALQTSPRSPPSSSRRS